MSIEATHRMPHRCVVTLLTAVIYLLAGTPTRAQPTPEATRAVAPTPAGPADDFDRGVPRTSVRGFLEACWKGDYERAANYLDLRRLPAATRKSAGPELARELDTVLSRTLWVDPEFLSDAPEGAPNDGLPARRDLLGTVQTATAPVPLLLERVPREDGRLVWKIASETVAKIPDLYEEFGYGPLGDVLPAPFFEIRFLTLQLWQWIGLLLLILLTYVAAWSLAALLIRIARPIVARARTVTDGDVLTAAVGPLRLIIGVTIFYAGSDLLALPLRLQTLISDTTKIIAIVTTTWLTLRLVDLVAARMGDRLASRGRTAAAAILPLGRRTAKATLTAVAALALFENLGFNITGLIAGFGVGGLAVALAAQETVKNFFGGVALIADQPVRVGDFCRFGDKMGIVEDISIWSTRVRTLDRTVVSVPNGQFASMSLENFARRDRIWLHTTIGLQYGIEPERLRAVLAELKSMLTGHPKVHHDSAQARFAGFGGPSLQIEISAYVMTASLSEFMAIREGIFLQVMDVVKAGGGQIAAL